MTHMQTRQQLAKHIREKIESEYGPNTPQNEYSKTTTEFQDSILFGLSFKSKGEIYQGTVSKKVIDRRRAKNKRARKQRVANLRASKRK